MPDDLPSDLQRLKAMVAQLEGGSHTLVGWICIYQLARGILTAARDGKKRA